jgi:uncharacterized membrane protein
MFNTAHLHPMIVHFPIALILTGFLADVISIFIKSEKCLSRTGFYLMILGALAAVAAWGSGHLFTSEPAQGAIADVFEKHETSAMITVLLMVTGSLLRIWLVWKKKEESVLKWVVFGLFFLAFCAVFFTGFLGGTMVYNYMMSL